MMKIKKAHSITFTILLTAFTWLMFISGTFAQESSVESSSKVILASEVEWTHLNPARGNKAPKAGTLWGDRNGTEATGFLLKPSDGFSSPPHIHNVSYRGIVISGLIHNDDPNAANMWMPSGSFWTQPKGEVHITAAKGSNTFAYIEIEKGPYLVLPSVEAFDSGERPVNMDETNIVWLDASDITWIDQSQKSSYTNGPKVAVLWKDNQFNGTLIKLPPGFNGKVNSNGSTFHAVVIHGKPMYQMQDQSDVKLLEPGSYFSSNGKFTHQISSNTTMESIIYVRTDGKFDIISD